MGFIAMDHLPSEMVEEIASYLTIEDVVACSRVSVKWDKAFNVPGVWKRFVTLDPKYFEKKSSTQHFSLDKIIQNQGDPCKYKELALKEFFIKHNFLSGKHHVEEIDLGNKYVDCVKEWVDAEGNHWLFVSLTDGPRLKSNHQIQVWNINQSPVLQSCSVTPPSGWLIRAIDAKFKVTQDRLIYLQDDLVLLYEFAHPQYELKFLTHVYSTLFRNFNTKTNMIYLPGIIIGFAYTFQHICIGLNPCYEVWNQIGIPITSNFEEEVYRPSRLLRGRPNLLIKTNHFNKIILSCNYNDGDYQLRFEFKIFDGNDYQFTNISFTKSGRVQDFNVSANLVTYIATETRYDDYYVGQFNVDNGNELWYSSIYATIDKNCPSQTRLILGNRFLLTIYKKKLSFYIVDYLTPLRLDSTFKFIKNDGNFCALTRNFAVVPSFDKDKGYYLFHFKTGKNMCKIKLPVLEDCLPSSNGFAYFYYKKRNQVPTRFIVYPDPQVTYCHDGIKTCISLVSFW